MSHGVGLYLNDSYYKIINSDWPSVDHNILKNYFMGQDLNLGVQLYVLMLFHLCYPDESLGQLNFRKILNWTRIRNQVSNSARLWASTCATQMNHWAKLEIF